MNVVWGIVLSLLLCSVAVAGEQPTSQKDRFAPSSDLFTFQEDPLTHREEPKEKKWYYHTDYVVIQGIYDSWKLNSGHAIRIYWKTRFYLF